MATKKAGLGKGLDSLITNKVAPTKPAETTAQKDEKVIEGILMDIKKVEPTANSHVRILMKMLCLNYQNLSNSSVYYSHYLFRIKKDTMRLLPVSVDGVQQSLQE